MGNDDEGLSHLVTQLKEQTMQFLLVLAVQTSTRLIGHNHSGMVHQGTSHCYTLLLATRQFVGLV